MFIPVLLEDKGNKPWTEFKKDFYRVSQFISSSSSFPLPSPDLVYLHTKPNPHTLNKPNHTHSKNQTTPTKQTKPNPLNKPNKTYSTNQTKPTQQTNPNQQTKPHLLNKQNHTQSTKLTTLTQQTKPHLLNKPNDTHSINQSQPT